MQNNDIKQGINNRLFQHSLIKWILTIFLIPLFHNVSLAQCADILDTAIIRPVACHGEATGDINLVLNHPSVSYDFFWNNLEITEDISLLSPGLYQVTITNSDTTSCYLDTSFLITEPQDPLSSVVNLYQDVDCFGDSTGVAYANAAGGTLPYSYLWSNGQTQQLANGLWAATHTVTITDTNNCVTTNQIEIVNSHLEIAGTIDVIQDVSCFGACDGIAVLSSAGGVLQHSYDWDIGQTYIGSGPDTAFNLCYGGHDVIIEDALGCRKTVPFIITQPDELFTEASQVQPVQCYGFDDGIASAVATGGTPPYSFVWDSINGPTGQYIDSLTPGVHTIYVTDANGCMVSDTVVIQEPTQLEVIIVDSMTIYPYCAGTYSGQLCALASGGTPSYVYSWNDDLHQTTPCATDIIPQYNDYTVIVMDDRNCIATASFQLDSITNSMNPDSVLVDINDVTCFGIYDGSIGISNVVGAVPPFTYSWNGPGTYTGTGDYISALYAGSYAVVIEDSNGCAITVNAEVDEPDQLEYTTYNVIDETCFGACNGQIWVNVTGGTGNYYYDFSENGTFPIPAADQVQLINDSLIFDLCTGDHNIYVTDDNNCEGAVVFGGRFEEYVDSGVVVTLTGVATSDASCFNTNDGQAWIQWPGADPLFNYTWETDPIGTVIDTGVSTSILYPGTYNLVVHYSDSASFGQAYTGCDLVEQFVVEGPNPVVSNAIITDVSCFGDNDGQIQLNPSSDAPGTPSILWDTTTSIPGLSTADFQSPLQPGTYTATITDSDGCTITEDYTVLEPDAITASISFVEPLCYGDANGSATVTVNGGSGSPGTWGYSWSPIAGNNATVNNIPDGVHTVTVTDGNGCVVSFSVTVTEPASISASVEPNLFYNEDEFGNPYHISCNGSSDGALIASTGGGVPPMSYSWDNSASITEQATGLPAGSHTVTITDDNNCSETATFTLIEPDILNPNGEESDRTLITDGSGNDAENELSCFGIDDGWAKSNTFGGVPFTGGDYQYFWENDNNPGVLISSQYIAENLAANTSYTVTVTDANGCVASWTTSVYDQPEPFIVDVTTTDYAGATHAPFSVNFLDNTVSAYPYSAFMTHTLYTLEYPTAPFNPYPCESGAPCNDSITVITTDNNPNFNPDLDYDFDIEEIGLNVIEFILTNDITGCQDSASFNINVQGIISTNETNNVFTPNGDGWNDEFTFGEHGMESIDVQIFNRWGQLVYSWAGQNKSWDGKGTDGQDLPEAVYFYILNADGQDGYYYEEKGSITLVR